MREVARNWQDSRSTNQQSVIQRAYRAIGRDPVGKCRRATPAELVCNEKPCVAAKRSRPHERDIGEPVIGDTFLPATGAERGGRHRPARCLCGGGPRPPRLLGYPGRAAL